MSVETNDIYNHAQGCWMRLRPYSRAAETHQGHSQSLPEGPANWQEVGVILFFDFDGDLHPEAERLKPLLSGNKEKLLKQLLECEDVE